MDSENRVCSRCHNPRIAEAFVSRQGEQRKTCNVCRDQKKRDYDPEYNRARQKKWKRENPEKVREANRRYAKRHLSKLNEKSKRYGARHPDRIKAAARRQYDSRKASGYNFLEGHRKKYLRNPIRVLAKAAITRAKALGIPYEDRIVQELESMGIPKKCPVYGIPIIVAAGPRTPNKPSIDRVIPSIGYVSGNVRIVSWKANQDKRDLDVKKLNAIARYIKANTARNEQIASDNQMEIF